MRLSITNTVVIFVVTALAIVLVIVALSMVGGGRGDDGRRAKRYRPGRPYDFTPIWFVSSPGQVTSSDPVMQPQGSSAVAGRAQPPAIESGVVETGGRVPQGATGGASDRW